MVLTRLFKDFKQRCCYMLKMHEYQKVILQIGLQIIFDVIAIWSISPPFRQYTNASR